MVKTNTPAAPKVPVKPVAVARICEHCGDWKPVGQSCGCFDNGCE